MLKLSEPASILRFDGGFASEVKAEPVTEPVVDTTAAGDSFAAAYIAARLAGADPIEAARAGHRLAGVVVCHPGAIIPRAAMPPGHVPDQPILARHPHDCEATRQEKLAALFKPAGVIPVLTIERLEDAVPLARALVAGGVRVLEVTLRTPVAVEAAKAMIAEVPEAIVGIGTILNADDLARARSARRQIRHQPRRDAGTAEGRRRQRPAVRAGDRDGFRTDAGAGGRASIW